MVLVHGLTNVRERWQLGLWLVVTTSFEDEERLASSSADDVEQTEGGVSHMDVGNSLRKSISESEDGAPYAGMGFSSLRIGGLSRQGRE